MDRRIVAAWACAFLAGAACAQNTGQADSNLMVVSSFSGPVMQSEIDSFKAYLTTIGPAASNIGNAWAQGASGEQTKAMGLVYEISHDTVILDKMLTYCDAVLSERNDLVPKQVGQYVIWTGRQPMLTTLHVVNGAALLATTVLLAVRLGRSSTASTPNPLKTQPTLVEATA